MHIQKALPDDLEGAFFVFENFSKKNLLEAVDAAAKATGTDWG